MPAGCFLNRAPLRCYRFLLRLAFSPCSWFVELWQVPDLRPSRADFSLLWFCVRIHGESLAAPILTTNGHELTRIEASNLEFDARVTITIQRFNASTLRKQFGFRLFISFVFIGG
jgi:hypothetical protein